MDDRRLREFVRYLVVRKLSDGRIYDSINLYVNGFRPSDIARKVRISRCAVRRYVGEVRVLTGNWVVCKKYLDRLHDVISKIKPIMMQNYCTVCGKHVYQDVVVHVRSKHKDLVEKLVEEVYRYACNNIQNI